MHIHILGVCGTFMGGIAAIAQQLGHRVTGADANIYPPMSTMLEQLGIDVLGATDMSQLDPQPDLIIVGNALSRGQPVVEAMLDAKIPYLSGPEWLGREVLQHKWVIAISGTHGKTTTASMVAHILERAGYQPGFLIGGVVPAFNCSARLTDSDFFVIEADEYDTAFFDKRSKFLHYHPDTLVINNLEFDHADIFPDLAAIQRQFEHLLRTVPGRGQVIYPRHDENVQAVLDVGCWSETKTMGAAGDWSAQLADDSGREFRIHGVSVADSEVRVRWQLLGQHNVANGLAAVAACHHAGVPIDIAAEALADFQAPKRRLEWRGEVNQITLYDDFAHHPTAIATTLSGLQAAFPQQRILAVLEPRSNTMRQGVHRHQLGDALALADKVFMLQPETLSWKLGELSADSVSSWYVADEVTKLTKLVVEQAQPNDIIVVMSNGGFGGIHEQILSGLATVS